MVEFAQLKKKYIAKIKKNHFLYNIFFRISRFPKEFRSRLSVFFLARDLRYEKSSRPLLPHGGLGVVIAKGVEIGKDVTIFQNVTIGNKRGGVPKIEEGVTIYPHCIIIGNITIGKNSIIGAGTFVNKDIPPNSTVYNPRELKIIKNE